MNKLIELMKKAYQKNGVIVVKSGFLVQKNIFIKQALRRKIIYFHIVKSVILKNQVKDKKNILKKKLNMIEKEEKKSLKKIK